MKMNDKNMNDWLQLLDAFNEAKLFNLQIVYNACLYYYYYIYIFIY